MQRTFFDPPRNIPHNTAQYHTSLHYITPHGFTSQTLPTPLPHSHVLSRPTKILIPCSTQLFPSHTLKVTKLWCYISLHFREFFMMPFNPNHAVVKIHICFDSIPFWTMHPHSLNLPFRPPQPPLPYHLPIHPHFIIKCNIESHITQHHVILCYLVLLSLVFCFCFILSFVCCIEGSHHSILADSRE